MLKNMSFNVKNLGPINEADLEIDKMTVIVGKNSTGKSTSSKFLFSILTAASNDGINLANCDIKYRFRELINLLALQNGISDFESVNGLLQKSLSNELFFQIHDRLEEIINKIESTDIRNLYLEKLNRIHSLIEINEDPATQYIKVANSILDSEFGYSLKNYDDVRINFKGISDGSVVNQEIYIKDDSRYAVMGREFLEFFNFENIIYIDSPAVLEVIWNSHDFKDLHNKSSNECIDESIPFHLQLLIRKLKNTNNNTVYDEEYYKNLIRFKGRIDDLLGGNFTYDINNDKFLFNSQNTVYPMENTASGFKQLGIIQLLLENRELTENSFLIIDEPEVNLHPEFQVKLAEVLVLATMELSIKIYINTHSPFLAEAIEVYSKYYGIYEGVNFYLTEKAAGNKFDYVLVENEDVMDVYNNLGNPFELLNKIRFKTELT